MKNLSEKLADKLIEMGFELKENPIRHHTSYNLRECGAWRWSALSKSGRIGSPYSMKDCVNSKSLSKRTIFYIDTELLPDE